MEPPSRVNDLIGRTIGHYRILEHLGAGGMGEVFRARDQRLRREVALKILARGLLADPRARSQFRSEALTLSRINHPNVETVFDFNTFDDLDILVLELIPGTGLDERLRAAQLPEREIVELGRQLAAGLAAMHECGVVHHDLKPGNLRVTPDGRLKILDLGLATLTPKALTTIETQTGFSVPDPSAGTLPYMAPEQIRGGPIDARTDIYAAGAVLYEMSCGRAPFRASSPLGLASEILHAAPAPLREMNPATSADFERLVMKALDKEPELRYQTAREMLVDLDRLSSSSSLVFATGTSRDGAWTAGDRKAATRRSRWPVYAGALILLAAVVTALWLWAGRTPDGRPFTARDWALVADFSSNNGQAAVEQTLREALTVALRQSRYVNVLPRERIMAALGRMARSADTRVDRVTALDVGRRENVAVVLAGTIDQSPAGSRVSVEGVNVADGRTLFVEQEELGSGAPLHAGVDRLAARVRGDLGESLDQVQKSRPLAEATTTSTEALERYSRGADEFARGNLEEGGRYLRAAVALDPGFAAAHELLARVYGQLGDPGREREHLELAWTSRARLTERERLVIAASHASLHGDYEQALENLQTLVGLYPDDAPARYELGTALNNAGRKEAAVKQLRQALEIDPHFFRARGNLMIILTEINQPTEALRMYDEARARRLVTPDVEWGRALALFAADRIDEARQEMTGFVARAAEPYKLYAELYLDRLSIYAGQFGAARSSLADHIRGDEQGKRAYPERTRRYLLGRMELLAGDAAAARREAQAILMNAGDVRPEHAFFAGVLAVLARDVSLAERALLRLRDLTGQSSGFAAGCQLHLKGEIDRLHGRVAPAIENFRQSAAAYPNYLPHQSLARMYEAQRRLDAAIREWEAVAAARGDILRNGFPADWVVAQAHLARLYAQAGQREQAAASCSRVLSAWKHGDDSTLRRSAMAPCGEAASSGR